MVKQPSFLPDSGVDPAGFAQNNKGSNYPAARPAVIRMASISLKKTGRSRAVFSEPFWR